MFSNLRRQVGADPGCMGRLAPLTGADDGWVKGRVASGQVRVLDPLLSFAVEPKDVLAGHRPDHVTESLHKKRPTQCISRVAVEAVEFGQAWLEPADRVRLQVKLASAGWHAKA